MRKLVLIGSLALVGGGMLAMPAVASFDHHFTVIGIFKNGDQTDRGFEFREKLVRPHNHRDKVGHNHVLCRAATGEHNRSKCKGRFHLNGELGGEGEIRVRGNFGPGDHRLQVVGGGGDFNGVAGKLLIRDESGRKTREHFDLTR